MLKDLYRFKQVSGIAVHVQPDGEYCIDGCLLSVRGQQLNIDKRFKGIKDKAKLNGLLPSKAMITLNLTGKGVLTKQIDSVEPITAANFSQLLPNANPADFYIQQFVSGQFSYVSLVRKTEADHWFSLLQEQGFYPVSLSLGPFVVVQVLSELNVYSEELVFNGHLIERNESGEWQSYRYDLSAHAPFKLKIQGEMLDEELILPYAGAFQLILGDRIDLIQAAAGSFDEQFRERHADKRFKTNALMILFSVFLLLLGNFILFSWLQTNNEQLQQQFNQSVKNFNAVKVNTENIREKESVLKALGWDGGLNKSVLVDQIAALLPSDLQWTLVSINPVDTYGSQQRKSLLFSNKCIKISGQAEKLLSVNEWLARIKTKPWVKTAQLENYTYDHELNTGVFTLNITY